MRLVVSSVFLVLIGLTSCSKIGKSAPSFSFTSIDGQVIDSESLKDKIIVVNVWATWCHTCIKEIPELNRLHSKYADDTTVVFLALCDEDKRTMDVLLTRFPFNYQQVSKAEEYTKKLQTRLVKTYPQNVIIDHDFNIVFEVSDGSADIFTALDNKITEIQNLTNS
jgi:thiol-disulfide isomerase/thioredoxin